MSGGSMDYAFSRVNEAIEALVESTSRGGNHPVLRRRLSRHLQACSEALRVIEWADSCDYGPDDWLTAAEAVLGGSAEVEEAGTPRGAARFLSQVGLGDIAAAGLRKDGREPAENKRRWPVISTDGYVGEVEIRANGVMIAFSANRRYEPGPVRTSSRTDGTHAVWIGKTRIGEFHDEADAAAGAAEAAAKAEKEPAAYWSESIYNRKTYGLATKFAIPIDNQRERNALRKPEGDAPRRSRPDKE